MRGDIFTDMIITCSGYSWSQVVMCKYIACLMHALHSHCSAQEPQNSHWPTTQTNQTVAKPQLKRRRIAQEVLVWTGLMLDKHWSVSCGLTGNWAECLVPLMSQTWTCKISWICKQLDVKRRVLRQWQCFGHCVGKANSYVPHCITKGKP